MYLLIHADADRFIDLLDAFTSHYVSINSADADRFIDLLDAFTSHYVSINSCSSCMYLQHNNYLHPTMYLLIPTVPLMLIFF